MVVGVKDAAKMVGIMILSGCAVLVCTLFLNYNMDIVNIRNEILSEQVLAFYNAQVSVAKMVSAVSGGCLLVTSVIMLIFYIKHYIDTHKKEIGILKALGYSRFAIARNFWVFGLGIFVGTFLGFCGAWLLMPKFYEVQNEDHILPEMLPSPHIILFLSLVLIPTLIFASISILYSYLKLKTNVLALIKDKWQISGTKKILGFFVLFASFCFSAMTQMAFSMDELASVMMGVMIMGIGMVLACTTLVLAITTVVNGNKKTIAMMRVLGYSQRQCCKALLGRYRPLGYAGFAAGSIYQYALLKFAVSVLFKDVVGIPEYQFDFPMMWVSLCAFVIIYELLMYCYSEKIKKISVKEIMLK